MIARHGISHGAATLVTGIVAALIADEIRWRMPRFSWALETLGYHISRLFNLPPAFGFDVIGWLLLASLLAVLWGVVFGALTNRQRIRSRWE